MMTIKSMRDRANSIRETHKAVVVEIEREKATLASLHERRLMIETVSDLVSRASQAAQMQFGAIVSGVVTESLNSVYPNNPYEFRLEFRESAGKTVVDTLLYRDGQALNPLASTGGGVWDVLAFALRVSLFILTANDDTRRLLVLDEPFKFLHGAEKIRRAYETMESVGKRFDLTILCARQGVYLAPHNDE